MQMILSVSGLTLRIYGLGFLPAGHACLLMDEVAYPHAG